MSRRPILVREQPHLKRLGTMLATTRRALGLTQQQVALDAGMHWTHLQRLELGTRRTRRSTLRRLAAVFVVHEPKLGPVDELADMLADAAGPSLAEESAYAERVARRRARRLDAAYRQAEREHEVRVMRFLFEYQQRPNRLLRSEEEIDGLRREMWGYFTEQEAEVLARRRAIESLSS
jgi:transcriptional regulator with XRE-family HTH domain